MQIDFFQDKLLTLKGRLFQNQIRNFEKFTKDQIKDYQLQKIKSLLSSAYREVSYYRDLFWKIGFDPQSFEQLSDLKKLPILSKDDVRENYYALISGKRMTNSIKLATSGTTGERLEVYTSPEQWIIEQSAIWRHWHIAGYKFRDKMAIIRSYSPKKNEKFYKFNNFKNWLYISPYHLNEKYFEEIFDLLIKWKPKYIRGYPSSIYLLARYALKKDIKLKSLKGILTASEKLTLNYRKVIEKAFKVRVFDHYGQAEISVMFHEWDDHTGMNHLDYYGYAELIETDDKSVFKLIATNLHNKVMPLIRYDTGDYIRLDQNIKKDGKSNFLKVSEIIGRSDDLLLNSNGEFIPSVNFYTFFSDIKEIIRFQFIIDEKDIELKLLIDKEARESDIINYVQNEMSIRFGKKINIISTDKFIQSEEGKFSAFIKKI